LIPIKVGDEEEAKKKKKKKLAYLYFSTYQKSAKDDCTGSNITTGKPRDTLAGRELLSTRVS